MTRTPRALRMFDPLRLAAPPALHGERRCHPGLEHRCRSRRRPRPPFNPPLESRNLAIVHAAMFDAVNSILREFHPYAVSLDAPRGTSAEAAVAAAAHFALVQLYPDQRTAVDAAYADSLGRIPDGPPKTNGISLGEAVASKMLAARASDGAAAAITARYTPGTGPGAWIPTPPGFVPRARSRVGQCAAVRDGGRVAIPAGPPPSLTSRLYSRDFDEIKEIGSSTSITRTQEQSDVARFWVATGPQNWNPAARQVAVARGLSLCGERPAVCAAQPGRRGRVHRCLGREVRLQPVAPGDGDPRGRRATGTEPPRRTLRGLRCS